jgi:predicted glycosyltransferase
MRARVLLYCQHLSGAGHFVRTFEIARALAERHDVHMVDGGFPVPRPAAAVALIAIPRLYRHGDTLTSYSLQQQATPLLHIMRERSWQLRQAVAHIQPDALLVEHFPSANGSWPTRSSP